VSLLEPVSIVVQGGALVDYSIKPIWLKTLDALRELDQAEPCVVQEAAGAWKNFGESIGLYEENERKQAFDAQSKRNNGLVGCAWSRCVLHEQATPAKRVMLLDRCRTKQYCSGTRLIIHTLSINHTKLVL
jgi:hypothetical protein